MTTDREMLEFAAKAMQKFDDRSFRNFSVCDHAICLELGHKRGAITSYWNPLTNSADCAAMCAKLGIASVWTYAVTGILRGINCYEINHGHYAYLKDHNNDREAAWRFAACKVAEAIGRAMK